MANMAWESSRFNRSVGVPDIIFGGSILAVHIWETTTLSSIHIHIYIYKMYFHMSIPLFVS